MSRLFIVFFLMFFACVKAQIHEVGVFVGESNFIGDVGSTMYVNPNGLVYGLVYKKNQNKRLAYRFSVIKGTIKSNDLSSSEASRKFRGYNFTNKLTELSAGIEFNFSDFNVKSSSNILVPYTHFGLSYSFSNDMYATPTEIMVLKNSNSFVSIPMALGIKSNIFPHFNLALEVGARYTFTDNLDGSNSRDKNVFEFGNINNNDWYIFTGITLTYSFGRPPCYCAK